MSEQIREQISAFLDGELPDSEADLLLRRLTRDAELRAGFGRFALIGEVIRGSNPVNISKGFAARVTRATDGESVHATSEAPHQRARPWWRPLAGVAVAAGVASVAIVALQQRAAPPALRAAMPVIARSTATSQPLSEAISYTVPALNAAAPGAMPAARLTNYVFAHSKYS